MTSAAMTGARVAVLALPDPNHDRHLTAPLVWSAVGNRRGVMIDSTGNMSKQAAFRVISSTLTLSNANPNPNDSLLGFAGATLVVWLLQPPLGLSEEAMLSCTVMCRCLLECVNPIAGFGLMQQDLAQNPDHPSGPPAWTLTRVTRTAAFPDSHQLTSSAEAWGISHVGNIPLAGGIYFMFWNAGGKSPTYSSGSTIASTGTSAGVTITGEPLVRCVYQASYQFPPWENNRRERIAPRYFAIISGFATGHVLMVGFYSLSQACNQVLNRWMLIPGGSELCVRYRNPATWGDWFPGPPESQVKVAFWEAYRGPNPAPVYSDAKEVSWTGPGARMTTTAPVYTTPQPRLATTWSHYPEEFDQNPFDSDDGAGEDDLQSPLRYYTEPEVPVESLTDDQLDQQLVLATRTLTTLELEVGRRQKAPVDNVPPPIAVPPTAPPLPVDVPPAYPGSMTRHRSWWDMLKGALHIRRSKLEPDET